MSLPHVEGLTAPPSPDEMPVVDRLAALLALDTVGLGITRAVIHGHGSRASADLFLSDGDVIEFRSLRDIANPKELMVEVTATTGAMPRLDAKQAQLALRLVRLIAEHQQVLGQDDISREMGVTFLQSADVLDVDLNDQAERWAAFSHLENNDPWQRAQLGGGTYASCCVVLRHHDSSRLVRCGWFYQHARSMDLATGQADVAHRMQRVGWERRGSRGAIKATAPGRNDQLGWDFYVVPAGWEDMR